MVEEAIRKFIRYLPVSKRLKLDWAEASIGREFKKELKKQKGISEEEITGIKNQWHFDELLIYEERESLFTNQLTRKARRLHVQVPAIGLGLSPNENWTEGMEGEWHLTDVGIAKVREEIDREEKRRREARVHWVQWITALTGLVGTLTGLFAILKK